MTAVRDILRTMDYGPAPESDDQARAWLGAHSGGFGHFIGGAFTPAGQTFDVFNPATGERIARVSQGGEADVAAAVAAARKALKSWSALSGDARARHLYALARHIQKRERLLAVLESLDNGKPIRESRDIDVPLVARHFYHHAGWASLIADEFPGHEPVGVCGQIIPWNFPLLMLAWKIAPALAAGNTVVLKPAEFTPLTALCFAEICVEVGLPPGVVNIVTGDGATGAALVAHEGVDKIAFTGSTEVGRLIRQATAGTGKKLSLELGGKSPFVVFEDADLDSAVEGVVDAIWFNQGQVCCAGSRMLVAEGIAERMYAKLRARMATLRVGDPLDKSIDIGAIVAPVQLERIKRLVEAGEREGATVWRAPGPLPERGCFYPPTLVTDVEPASILAREEIFGPVLVAMTFRTPDEAVALANNTRYGLAASVWTENINRAFEVAAKIKAGVVWINSTNLFDAASGFGGYRESGFGREGGREGLAEYLVAPAAPTKPAKAVKAALSALPGRAPAPDGDVIDRTAKLYIGGKQARPDSGYCYSALDPDGGRRPGRARQPQGHPQRGRGGRQGVGLGRGDGAQPRAGALLSRRESRSAQRRVRRAAHRPDRRVSPRGARRSRDGDAARLLLRRLRRQVRRRGACDQDALRHTGDERTVGRDGHRLPRRGAAARLRFAGPAGDRHGQPGRRRPFGGASAQRHRLLFGARHVGRAGRRRQHRHRRSSAARQDARRARRRRRGVVRRAARTRRGGRGGLGGQSQGDLDAPAAARLDRRAGPRIPAPRDASEEHLGALRGVRRDLPSPQPSPGQRARGITRPIASNRSSSPSGRRAA